MKAKLLLFTFIIFIVQTSFISTPQQQLTALIIKQISKHLNISIQQNLDISPTCFACHKLVKAAKYIPLSQSTIYSILQAIGITVCTMAKIQIKQVCVGAVDQMVQFIIKSVWNHYTDPHLLCHSIRMCAKQYNILKYQDYAKQILIGKPNKTQQIPTGHKILNLLHISDLHPDIFYAEGSPTICDQPLCCRNDVKAINGSKQAGFWGSLAQCDVPLHTFNLFLDKMKHQHIDMVVWTGDNTAHDIWKQSQQYNNNFTNLLSTLIKNKINAPIFPAKGNHQSYPVNVYEWGNQEELNTGLANAWSDFIGVQATKMLKQKGYFSLVNEKFNLKVISLNTEAANNLNWILLKQPTDPGKQLQWLKQQLLKSQNLNQFVYIIGHIPPNELLSEWGTRYNALIDRFNYIIRGQYFGHTHDDHMAFFTSINDTNQKIINQYMVAPSFTTSTFKNPRYRILKIDQDTMRVMDYSQYVLRLQKYQSRDVIPTFQLQYSFLNQYGLDSFSFQNLEKFRSMLKNDPQIQKKYTFYEFGGVKAGKVGPEIQCQTRTTLNLVSECLGKTFKKSIFQKVAGPWKQLKHKY